MTKDIYKKRILNRGMPVIGLGPRHAEYAQLPLQWMPHIQVVDVAVSLRRKSNV